MTADPTQPIARELGKRGLAAPAHVLLEAHRPFRPLLGLAATFLLPLARPLLGDWATQLQQVAERDDAYERLVRRLGDEAGR